MFCVLCMIVILVSNELSQSLFLKFEVCVQKLGMMVSRKPDKMTFYNFSLFGYSTKYMCKVVFAFEKEVANYSFSFL